MIYAAAIRGIGVVKIGYTSDPRQRLCALRRKHGQKMKFLGLCKGSKNDERILHEKLRQYCMGSECYPRRALAILRAVADLCARSDATLLNTMNAETRKWARQLSKMSVQEVAALYDCKPQTVYSRYNNKELEALRKRKK